MSEKMSKAARTELVARAKIRYGISDWSQKRRILDELANATGYSRKHTNALLIRPPSAEVTLGKAKRHRRYDGLVQEALIILWNAASCICSKRLTPFLPELLAAMERRGHLSLEDEVRERLLSMSAATVDRLLYQERHPGGRGKTTTRRGSLLKHQIPVRTFADWSDARPGFVEADLVAHCGESAEGSFLNTLVLTDISTGWTECVALLRRSEADVSAAIGAVRQVLPFPLLGLDTDNGGEFINYELLRYCQQEQITFTRCRPYKKNDQAHVEEKNGSVVRRLVGYDRYEGVEAWQALTELYRVLRLYVNYFQPSLKLKSKQREGARVTKRYEPASTPYQRTMASETLPELLKDELQRQYGDLDPVMLLKRLQGLQDRFWEHAYHKAVGRSSAIPRVVLPSDVLPKGAIAQEQKKHNTSAETTPEGKPAPATTPVPGDISNTHRKTEPVAQLAADRSRLTEELSDPFREALQQATGNTHLAAMSSSGEQAFSSSTSGPERSSRRTYRRSEKPRAPHTWRTRADPFAEVLPAIHLQLLIDPSQTAKDLFQQLQKQYPGQFEEGQLRTLQRRVKHWRRDHLYLDHTLCVEHGRREELKNAPGNGEEKVQNILGGIGTTAAETMLAPGIGA